MKYFAFLMLVFIFGCFNKNANKQFSFKKITFDTLHIYPDMGKGSPLLSQEEVLAWGLVTDYQYQAVAEFDLNNGRRKGFLVREMNEGRVYLLNFSPDMRIEGMQKIEVASYEYIEGAMECTCNSWLLDLGGKIFTDLLVICDLVDFEVPREFSSNISSTRYDVYMGTIGGRFKQKEMQLDDLSPFRLRKPKD